MESRTLAFTSALGSVLLMNNSGRLESPALSRREVFKASAAVAASAALSGIAEALPPFFQSPKAQIPGVGAFAGPLASPHALVHRITFGYSPAEAKLFDSKGFAGYLEYHLAPDKIVDSVAATKVANLFPSYSLSPYQAVQQGYQAWDYIDDSVGAQITRQLFSKRQLYEIMVDFWMDHFNVYCWKAYWYFPPFVRDVIRPNALGTFPALLNAVAASGAMMEYLDNSSNRQGNYNENFARELLELHTIGVESAYPEDEVYTVTRCFTGWSNVSDPNNKNFGAFVYNDVDHEQYPKHLSFLNMDIPAYGRIKDGQQVLTALASHPSTKRHIAKKLITKFLTYSPPEALISAVVDTYTKTGGDIKAMLRVILTPANLTTVATPKLKRPNHFVASATRATNSDMDEAWGVWDILDRGRQVPFNWAPPNGYPDRYDSWSKNLLPRWLFGNSATVGQIYYYFSGVLGLFPSRKPSDIVASIETNLFGCVLPANRKTQMLNYFARTDRATNNEIRELVGLVLAGPEFQWY
jgi:Protein of unknown function (DUF1800)